MKENIATTVPISHVEIYFSEKGWNTEAAIEFYKYYLGVDKKYKSCWKAIAFRWMLKKILQQQKNRKNDERKAPN